MATSYKTPGVYVEEITKFPPSVAEVETAVPAFIGYTEYATSDVEGDLINSPFRITSLLEYEQYFGQGPAYKSFTLLVDSSFVPVDTETSVTDGKFNLYDSVRLFYDNGGGACYIVSVNGYTSGSSATTIDYNELKAGLDAVRKFDEPTLLLFPDAVDLDADKLGSLQQQAIKQCADLGDRFSILDIKRRSKGDGSEDLDNSLADFRNNVGMNDIKYAAAYHPYLTTIYDKTFSFADVNKNLRQGTTVATSTAISFKDFFKDTDLDVDGVAIKTKIATFELLAGSNSTNGDNKTIQTDLATFYNGLLASSKDSDTIYTKLRTEYLTAADSAKPGKLKAMETFLFQMLLQIDALTITNASAGVSTHKISHDDFRKAVIRYATANLQQTMQGLVNLDTFAFSTTKLAGTAPGIVFDTTLAAKYLSVNDSGNLFKSAAVDGAAVSPLTAADGNAANFSTTLSLLDTYYGQIKAGMKAIVDLGNGYQSNGEDTLVKLIPSYKGLLKTLNAKVTTIPPSGAVVGVIADTDTVRGVWKAPANVSLASVSGIDTYIDDATQENMNVDPTAGKSVNAIRVFYGKGVLVWGARTLAGNDNEWRYVPVRRLFNFIEESCEKSTSWAVFEPNDANTWLRIKAQIENFLNNLWRRGALAGAKPEQAYIVNCGLGATMTAQDILEGRMNVEIAIAAVRPAEFIILKFSHKLQQS